MKKQTKLYKWFALIILMVGLVSCKSDGTTDLEVAGTFAAQTLAAMSTETATPEPTKTATPTKAYTSTPLPAVGPVGPVDFPEDVNPLTGLAVEDTTILDRRPVLVKVANYPASGRPHAGLSLADMVFEYYIGYGGNRFIGLYYGQNADKIGPVRSGRLVDPLIANLYEGILGIQGAYVTILDHIVNILGNRAISGTGNICPAICDDGRNIVISVFADSEALTQVADDRGVENQRYLLEGMAFDPDAPEGGVPGEQATILFSSLNRGDWRYDDDSGFYLRWIEDANSEDLEMIPLVDSETDEQLAFSNVVVIFANHTELAPTLHEIDMWDVSDQRAIVFRDGQAYDGTWATPNNYQPIQFFDQSGEILALKPGSTWVVIFGVNSSMTEEEGVWTFNFQIP